MLTTFGWTWKLDVKMLLCSTCSKRSQLLFMRYETWGINRWPSGRRELALDHAKTFYELFNLTAKELVTCVVERGAVFRELDYMNALQLLHRSQPHPDPAKYNESSVLFNLKWSFSGWQHIWRNWARFYRGLGLRCRNNCNWIEDMSDGSSNGT